MSSAERREERIGFIPIIEQDLFQGGIWQRPVTRRGFIKGLLGVNLAAGAAWLEVLEQSSGVAAFELPGVLEGTPLPDQYLKILETIAERKRHQANTHPYPPPEVGLFYLGIKIDKEGGFFTKERRPLGRVEEPEDSENIYQYPSPLTEGIATARFNGEGMIVETDGSGVFVVNPEGKLLAHWPPSDSEIEGFFRIYNMPAGLSTKEGLQIAFSGICWRPDLTLQLNLLKFNGESLDLINKGWPKPVNSLGTPLMYRPVNARRREEFRVVYPEGPEGLTSEEQQLLLFDSSGSLLASSGFPGVTSAELVVVGDIDPSFFDKPWVALLDAKYGLRVYNPSLEAITQVKRKPGQEAYNPVLVMVRRLGGPYNLITMSERTKVTTFALSGGKLSEGRNLQLPEGRTGKFWITSIVPLGNGEILVTAATDFHQETCFAILNEKSKEVPLWSDSDGMRFGSDPVVIKAPDGSRLIFTKGFAGGDDNRRAIFGHRYIRHLNEPPTLKPLEGFPKLFGTYDQGYVSVDALAILSYQGKLALAARIFHRDFFASLHRVDLGLDASSHEVVWAGLRGGEGHPGAPFLPGFQQILMRIQKNVEIPGPPLPQSPTKISPYPPSPYQ